MPAFRLSGFVLQREGEYSICLLDGILAIGFGRLKRLVDRIESLGGRESVCEMLVSTWIECAQMLKDLPFLRDMVGVLSVC